MNQYETASIVLTVLSGIVCAVCLLKIYVRNPISDTLASKISNVHVVCGLLHITSALILGWISAGESVVWEAPVYTFYALWQNTTDDSCSASGRCYISPKIDLVSEVPVAIIAILFGLISGYSHLISVAWLAKAKTLEYAESGNSPVRWIDYFFSASLMV